MQDSYGNQKITIKMMLVMYALIPLTVSLIVISFFAGYKLTQSVEENIKEELEMASASLREYYEYDLINENDLVDGFIKYDTEYIDLMGEVGIDFTVFNKNVRFMTTIKDSSSGKRIEGTTASDEVWNTVKRGESYYDDDVKINGIDYYVYYLPLSVNDDVKGMAFSGKPATDVDRAKKQLYIFLAVCSVVLETLFLSLAVLISKKVSAPLKTIAEDIEKLSNGNTRSETIAVTHIVETGVLIRAANKLSKILYDSIGKIKSETGHLKDAIENTAQLADSSDKNTAQIKESIESLTLSTNALADNVQKVNENVLNMGNMVDDIVNSTEALDKASSDMSEINEKTSLSIVSMAQGSEKTAQAIDSITQSIRDTNDSIAKVKDMVAIITDIASQTNLLALNASIEAARAGDAGRGFGVVASEIKRLAEQSDKSAEDIKNVVTEILSQSEQLVSKSEAVKDAVEKEQTILSDTKENFNALEENINLSVTEIKSVSKMAESLGDIKNEIAGAVSDLSAISQENAATNTQVSEAVIAVADNITEVNNDCDIMTQNAVSLENAVSYFS